MTAACPWFDLSPNGTLAVLATGRVRFVETVELPALRPCADPDCAAPACGDACEGTSE